MPPIRLDHFEYIRHFNIGDSILGAIIANHGLYLSQCAVRNIWEQVMFDLNIQPKTQKSSHDIVGPVINRAGYLIHQEVIQVFAFNTFGLNMRQLRNK